jgi:gliding motility-associated-like protein
LADVCANAAAFALTGGSPAGGVYSGNGVNGGIFNPASVGTGIDTITYTYTIPAGCSDSAKQAIHVTSSTALTVTPVGPLCINASPVTLVPNVSGGTFTGAGVEGSTFSPSSAGVGVHQIIYSTGGCASPDTIQIIVGDVPVVTAAVDQSAVSPGTTITLTGTSSIEGTYAWTSNPAITLSAPSALVTTAQPGQTTLFTFTVSTTANCVASDTVTVFINLPCLHPHKAFTPNGDGINDKWIVSNGDCVQTLAVNVYNRWGSLVFHSDNYTNDWQGTYKGSPLPDGTYYYVVIATLPSGSSSTLTGNVTIIR